MPEPTRQSLCCSQPKHGPTGTRTQDLSHTVRVLLPLSYRATRSTCDNWWFYRSVTGEEKSTWPDRDSNPGPLAYRASTLTTELPSHTVDLRQFPPDKTRFLHRTLLLPFSSISPLVDRRRPVQSTDGGSTSVPDSQPDVVDTRPPTVEPDSTVEYSDGGYDASISSCSQAGDDIALADASTSVSSRNGKYVVPAKRKPGMPGYKPHYTSSHVPSESSYSGRRRARPQRVRRKPQWMNPTVWDFSQPYTITVDRKDVAFL